ncbi:MAG: hypothetical protein R3B93_12310 [Bacteroidia bacterium]
MLNTLESSVGLWRDSTVSCSFRYPMRNGWMILGNNMGNVTDAVKKAQHLATCLFWSGLSQYSQK